MQPFWSKIFTAVAVDLTAIYMPWYVCKLTNISDLAFWGKPHGLFWVFFFHVLVLERNWFVIQEDLLSFSLMYGFRNDLVFFWCFSKLLKLTQSKNWSNICQYLAVSEVSVVPKNFGNFRCSFIENRYGKFYSHLGIVIKVHVLVSKVW